VRGTSNPAAVVRWSVARGPHDNVACGLVCGVVVRCIYYIISHRWNLFGNLVWGVW
jgi:hypothetical protein